jgi:hypothetical protein
MFTENIYSQQNATIYGTISSIEEKTGAQSNLEGAVITISSINKASFNTESGENGYYLINNVIPGNYKIRIEMFGYKPSEKSNVALNPGDSIKFDFLLSGDTYTTEEIDVISERFRQAQNDMRTSLMNLSPRTTKILPGAGEDVLRSLQSLPGVTAPNDFSSQLIVRGSGPDQNLIIMDDVEIFNPYRLYGVFSMFNPETLNEINLITGGFPSKYGDRLSAVLDVTNKEGSRTKSITGLTNINIANANLVFSGKLPIKNLPGSWIISSRRTYYDLILGPFAKNAGLIDESASFPAFQDVQAKISFGPFKHSKFNINAIFSKDGVDIIPGKSNEMEDSVSVRDVTKNDVISAAWHFAPSNKFLSKTTASWYRNTGDANFGGLLLDPVIDREIYDPAVRDSLRALGLFLGIGFSSKYTFRKYSLSNNTVFSSKDHRTEIGGGFDVIKTDLQFKIEIDERLKSFIQNNPNFTAINETFIEGKNYWRGHIFAQDRIRISKKLFIQPGVRFDYYDIIKKAYASPRFNLSYAFNDLTTLRAGAGLYYQSPGYEKLLDGQVFYDLSPEKTQKLEAEKSIQFILGFERWLSHEWLAKFETYYKKFEDLVVQEKLTGYRYEYYLNDPSNHDPNYISDPASWTRSSTKVPYDSLTSTPVNGAFGRAYGFEFYLEKRNLTPASRLSGWISYSLSWAQRDRNGLLTPFRYDQRHSLNIVANYRILNWLELGARFNFASNFPYTKPLGIKPRIVNDSLAVLPVVNKVQFDFDFGNESNKFADKKPNYHRLDVRATAYTRFWNMDWSFYIDVVNIYNNKNVIGYDYYIDNDYRLAIKSVGQFPLLPTIGLSARF